MNKKIISAFILLACLAFMPITSSADFPSGDLGYSDEIAVDSEFEWTVKTLDASGSVYGYTVDPDIFTVGDAVLEQGDKIVLTVLEDPDNATGDWYSITVDGVAVTNPTSINLGYSLYSYGVGGFISPVTYDDGSGVKQLYAELMDELVDVSDGDSYSTELMGLTMEYSYTEDIKYSLSGDTFLVKIHMGLKMVMSGGGYEMSIEMDMQVEHSINVVSGLLGHVKMWMDFDSSDYGSGSMHFLLDSAYTAVPYNWAYSLLGLGVIAAVVALAKRKRR